MLASEENGETVEGDGEKAGMSSSEEEEGKDETSLPSSPSDEMRWKASLPASKERREVAADKEVEQSMQVNKCFSFNPVTGERGGQLENMVLHFNGIDASSFQQGALTCEQSNLIDFQGGESGVGLEAVEFGEHPGEAGAESLLMTSSFSESFSDSAKLDSSTDSSPFPNNNNDGWMDGGCTVDVVE